LSTGEEYELVLTPPARRALTDVLPEAVAGAVIDFLTTALVQRPRRVGKPLRGDLAGVWSARRGTYRALYRLRDDPREVIVVRIEGYGQDKAEKSISRPDLLAANCGSGAPRGCGEEGSPRLRDGSW